MSTAGTSAPPSINPSQLGTNQAESNVATAAAQAGLNNVNTFSPFGSSTFTPSGTGPGGIGPERYTLAQSLSPELQQVFSGQTNLASGLAQNAAGLAPWVAGPAAQGAGLVDRGANFQGLPNSPVSTDGLPALAGGTNAAPIQGIIDSQGPIQGALESQGPIQGSLSFNGLPQLPSSATDFSNEVGQAQRAAYDTQAGYLDPQFSQKHSDLTQQLADQGISPGTAAYSRAQGDLGRQETMAYQQAKDAAVAAGNQEQSTLFGENLGARQQGVGEATTQGNFANAAQQQGFNQAAGRGAFANAAQQQGFNQAATRGQFSNAAQQQGFGQQLTSDQLENAARAQAFGERTTQFGEPLQALSAYTNAGEGILGGAVNDTAGLGSLANFAGTGTVPTTIGNTQISPANLAQAAQTGINSQANAFNAGTAINNQIGGAIGSLGGSLGLGNGGLGTSLFGQGGLSGLFGSGGLFGGAGAAGAADGGLSLSSILGPTLAPFAPFLAAGA